MKKICNFSREIKVVKRQTGQNRVVFTNFYNQIFFAFFLVKSKLLAAKKYKTALLSRIFHQFHQLQFQVCLKMTPRPSIWNMPTKWWASTELVLKNIPNAFVDDNQTINIMIYVFLLKNYVNILLAFMSFFDFLDILTF